MGIGITTLVTVMVVILLTAFSVLSLVTARSDLRLTTRGVDATSAYYAADGEAEQWYSELNAFLAGKTSTNWEKTLTDAGYKVTRTTNGALTVNAQFPIGTNRQLLVAVAIDGAGKPTVVQWQSESVSNNG
jgi:hypothetical protein